MQTWPQSATHEAYCSFVLMVRSQVNAIMSITEALPAIQQCLIEGMLKYTCNLKSFQGLPYHQLFNLSSFIFFLHCSLSVQINIMQSSSGCRGCAQHGAWSLLLGSSVDMDDIQMSTPGLCRDWARLSCFQETLHVTCGRHAGMPRLSYKQLCVLP